jgi:hypothetical protein
LATNLSQTNLVRGVIDLLWKNVYTLKTRDEQTAARDEVLTTGDAGRRQQAYLSSGRSYPRAKTPTLGDAA